MAVLTGTPLDDFEGDNPAPDPGSITPPNEGDLDFSKLDPKDYGGDRFDSSGNLIKENKIYKSKEALTEEYKLKNVTPPKDESPKDKEVDDTKDDEEYSLDKDGNLVNKKGEIYKKKGEFEVKEDGTVEIKEVGFVNSLVELAKTKGYDFKDENGNPLEFEDSEEGYFGVAEYLGEMKAISFISQMLESNPDLKNFYYHLQAGGKPEDFYKSKVEQVDYSKVTTPDNPASQEAILKDKYTRINNMTEANAQEFIDMLKASGNLELKAKEALAELQNWQKEQVEKTEKEVQDAINTQKENKRKELLAIHETVSKGNLGDINIPDNKRAEFYNYLTVEVEPGVTQAAKDYNSLPLEKQLVMEYLLFSKLNVDDLVKIKVANEKADLIKQKMNGKPIKITSNASLRTQGDPGGIEDIQ